jgi:hypothetical protein
VRICWKKTVKPILNGRLSDSNRTLAAHSLGRIRALKFHPLYRIANRFCLHGDGIQHKKNSLDSSCTHSDDICGRDPVYLWILFF